MKKKKFKLKEKHFEILIKVLIVISLSSLVLGIIPEFIFPNEKIRDIMMTIFITTGISFSLLMSYYENIARFLNKYFKTSLKVEEPILKVVKGKPYKYKFTYNTYNEFISYISDRAIKKSYKEYEAKVNSEIKMKIYENKGYYLNTSYLNFFVFFKTEELTEEIMREAKQSFEGFIELNYKEHSHYFNIMFVVAVEKPNEYYNKFIKNYIVHEEYDSYFGCGISLKDKEITIVHQKDGEGVLEYKCVENYFPSFMNFQSKDKLQ